MSLMWCVLGALAVTALWGVPSALSGQATPLGPGQWVGYLAWVLWTLSGIAVVWTFLDEREPRAAKVAALTLGGVSVLGAATLAPLWRLL